MEKKMQIAVHVRNDDHLKPEKIGKEFGAVKVGYMDNKVSDEMLKAQLNVEFVYEYPIGKEKAFLDYLKDMGVSFRELKPKS